MREEREGKSEEKTAVVAPATAVPPTPAPLVDLVLDGLSSEHSRRAYHRALELSSFAGTRPTPPGRGLQGRSSSAIARTSQSARCRRPRSTWALAALRKLATEAASSELLAPEAAAAILRVGGARRTRRANRQLADLAASPATARSPRPGYSERPARPRPAGAARGLGAAPRRARLTRLRRDRLSARAAGRSSIWSASTAASAPSRCRPGPRWRSTAGQSPPRSPRGPCCGASRRPAASALGRSGRNRSSRRSRLTASGSASGSRRTIYAEPSPSWHTRAGHRSSRSQISLGHASIQTTERYLGLRQNLHDAPCDRLGLVGVGGVNKGEECAVAGCTFKAGTSGSRIQ